MVRPQREKITTFRSSSFRVFSCLSWFPTFPFRIHAMEEEPKPSNDLTRLQLPTGEAPPKRTYAKHYDPAVVAVHFEPLLRAAKRPTPEERWARKTFAPFVWKGPVTVKNEGP